MIKKIKISELKKYPRNPRNMDKETYIQLINSIKEYGDSEVLVVNKDNEIIGGNHRLDAFLEVFGQDYEADCKIVDLPKNKEIKLNIALNGISGEFNTEMLKEIFLQLSEEHENLLNMGFNEQEINLITEGLIEPITEKMEKEIPIPDNPKYEFKRGEIIKLGNHTLMCGDCTDVKDMKLLLGSNTIDLVVTDPPYGVDYANKNEFLNSIDKGNRNQKDIENDAIDDYSDFFDKFIQNIIPYLNEYNSIYINMSGLKLYNLLYALELNDIKMSQIIVWAKNNHVLGRQDYANKHEFIVYGWKNKHKWYGSFDTTVWEIDKPMVNKEHPTMKPLELVRKCINNNSMVGNNVLDCFGGSGTTLIACEELNRNCFMLEIDPKYCSVIVERYENLTGKAHSKI